MKRNLSPLLAGIFAVISLVCAAACAVPLAPGYRIVREKRQIRFVPGQTPELAIQVNFTLVNAGTAELNYIDVRLPSEKNSGRSDLQVEVDGRNAAVTPLPLPEQQSQPAMVRVALEKHWMRKEKRALSFEYSLRAPSDSQSYVTVEPNSFHLGARGWAPQLQPPKYILSTHPSRPPKVSYTVRVPADFAIWADGERKGRKKDGDDIEYRYEVRGSALGAFAVAGRYATWPSRSKRNSVEFWTTQPLAGSAAQSARQIAGIWQTLTRNFGVFDKRIRAPRIVESTGVKYDVQGVAGPAAVSVPGVVLMNPAAFKLGIESDRFIRIASEALARNWFDEEVLPSADATIGMGDGLPEYAEIVTDEARNGPLARRQRIYEYLRRYDAAVKNADETPIASTTADSPFAQRRIALAKAPLFYIELEDACGEAPVRAGLAHLVATMRGQEVDYNLLRSALEESTGRELGKIFREWLHQKGIPKTFRARYPYGEGSERTGN